MKILYKSPELFVPNDYTQAALRLTRNTPKMGACVSKHPPPNNVYYTSEKTPSGTTPSTNTNDINTNDQHQEEIEREIEFAQKEEEEFVLVRTKTKEEVDELVKEALALGEQGVCVPLSDDDDDDHAEMALRGGGLGNEEGGGGRGGTTPIEVARRRIRFRVLVFSGVGSDEE